MQLEYTHDTDYFFFSQLLMRHIETYIQKHPDADNAIFDLRDIYEVFREDFAATTTNLEGILNIADEYVLETEEGLLPLISSHSINLKNHVLSLEFSPKALTSLLSGRSLVNPKAA